MPPSRIPSLVPKDMCRMLCTYARRITPFACAALPQAAEVRQAAPVHRSARRRPLRARGLRLAPDLPLMPNHLEGNRANPKRLVSFGFLDETEPGLFAQPGIRAPADQQS